MADDLYDLGRVASAVREMTKLSAKPGTGVRIYADAGSTLIAVLDGESLIRLMELAAEQISQMAQRGNEDGR